jgi:hypothetical protein
VLCHVVSRVSGSSATARLQLGTTPLLRLLQCLFVAEQVPGIVVTQRRSKNLDSTSKACGIKSPPEL